jgi:succinate dehydrogenase flavin-adding protein (antitoxin of CptAB toxin-antitoxin module)
MNNPLTNDTRRKKILFRSLHRGCKETDIVFERFANRYLDGLSDRELDLFEALLDEPDWDIWDAVSNPNSTALPAHYAPLIEKLRAS